ncbi:hypothetical protein HV211_05575 [Citrobacter freundii]|uniref:hypothetical protein n=1 Tax=Citrobacter freundii TaxID=546 RepID=UPI0015EA4F17|nr:hypothetical protein [Citrobacter freundii]QLY59983.1 hypothetical protein HV211_05575 [Citrobacter freundii]
MCRRAGLLCYDIGDTWEGAMCGAGSGWRAGVLGMAMPVAGVSLLLFMMIDWLRWYKMSQNLLAQSAE